MSWWEIVIPVVGVVSLVLELWFYDSGLFWHEPKTDRRNWTPTR